MRSRKPAAARRARILACLLGAAALAVGVTVGLVPAAGRDTVAVIPAAATAATDTAPQLHVSGNELVGASGAQVVLHGVDRSGTEYSCVQGNGIFDGPSDQASITAMKNVGVNAVRVPLNEACWNAESYVNPAYAGASYQAAIEAYVSLLNANGMVAILDLHWTDGAYTGPSSGCSSAEAVCEKPMPDSAESVPFWTSVANTFKGNDAVIFDLFNEPYPDRALPTETSAWQCWLNGGSSCTAGISYPVAGMQTLVDTVRSAGANNVIMLGGLAYSNDLSQWLAYKPTDPDNNLAASWHSYNFNACSTQSCWTSEISPVIAQVPLITGEIGENDCADTYIDPLMSYLDSEHTSYLAWAWNADFGCATGPGLITDYTGTPTAYGAGYDPPGVTDRQLTGGPVAAPARVRADQHLQCEVVQAGRAVEGRVAEPGAIRVKQGEAPRGPIRMFFGFTSPCTGRQVSPGGAVSSASGSGISIRPASSPRSGVGRGVRGRAMRSGSSTPYSAAWSGR